MCRRKKVAAVQAVGNIVFAPVPRPSSCGGTFALCIYPVSTTGVLGKPITLKDKHGRTVFEMQQGAITNSQSLVLVGAAEDVVIGGRCTSGVSASSVDRWNFPAGGRATNENTASTEFPFGSAISAK